MTVFIDQDIRLGESKSGHWITLVFWDLHPSDLHGSSPLRAYTPIPGRRLRAIKAKSHQLRAQQ